MTELGRVSTETLWVPHVLVTGIGMQCFDRIVQLEHTVKEHPLQLMCCMFMSYRERMLPAY